MWRWCWWQSKGSLPFPKTRRWRLWWTCKFASTDDNLQRYQSFTNAHSLHLQILTTNIHKYSQLTLTITHNQHLQILTSLTLTTWPFSVTSISPVPLDCCVKMCCKLNLSNISRYNKKKQENLSLQLINQNYNRASVIAIFLVNINFTNTAMITKIIDVKLLTCSSSANMRLSISISLISDCVSTKLAWSSFCRVLEFNGWCYILQVFSWRFLICKGKKICNRLKKSHLDTSSWLLYLSSNSSSLLKRSLLCSCNKISLFATISKYCFFKTNI